MSITSSDSEYQCIAPIDFISMTKVPESHTWVLNPCDENLLESIPTIDLLDPNAISLIRHACEKWGIFHVINHGVSSQLLDEVELQTRGLFSLPSSKPLDQPIVLVGMEPVEDRVCIRRECGLRGLPSLNLPNKMFINFGHMIIINAIISDSEYQCIAPIDFISMTKVPESHTWVLHPCDENLLESIPTIDLLDPNAISLIRHACEKWGIFHVINHGVSSQLLDEVELQTRGLFSLPFDQKLQAFRSANSISGYGTCRRSCLHPKRMWSEGDVMVMYRNEMNKLAETLLDLMFGSLGLTQEDTKQVKPKTGLKNPYGPLQLNSYPICPDPTKAMGLAAHTDTSLLTLLYQSNTPTSLQIFKEGIGWVPVHPLNGALIVNLGDLMQILSNGRFKSVLHRAVVNNTHHRISVANFYGPPNDVKLSPLIQLGNLDHLPLYRSVTWKEYLEIKAKHNTKALEMTIDKRESNLNTKFES
ncbi:hypothetical protein G4B88_000115 [Cannabis sativa]|uniref:Fe2OG dioxygenase domain-containing protein n=1 Tax=Cannabis sativa TaxID=3483 RepID=A0A7J6G0Q5_CANSA|nr:hypothetical protein G4B88_000115 [Cannabis sativa]